MTHAHSFNRPLSWRDIVKGALGYAIGAAAVLGPLAALCWWLA